MSEKERSIEWWKDSRVLLNENKRDIGGKFLKGTVNGRYYPIGAKVFKDGRCWIKIREMGHAWSNWKEEHRIIAEQLVGRELNKNEHVHHIDFDITNNNPDNLYVSENNSKHRKTHVFEPIMKELLDMGIIAFDKIKGVYYVRKT